MREQVGNRRITKEVTNAPQRASVMAPYRLSVAGKKRMVYVKRKAPPLQGD